MLDHVRASVAYISGRMISGKRSSHIYDYSRGRYIAISGRVNRDSVAVYDYESSAHISGRTPSLYHYGEGSHISLKLSDHRFSGYDYGSGSHFSGTVSGHSVTLYDYEKGRHFHYSV